MLPDLLDSFDRMLVGPLSLHPAREGRPQYEGCARADQDSTQRVGRPVDSQVRATQSHRDRVDRPEGPHPPPTDDEPEHDGESRCVRRMTRGERRRTDVQEKIIGTSAAECVLQDLHDQPAQRARSQKVDPRPPPPQPPEQESPTDRNQEDRYPPAAEVVEHERRNIQPRETVRDDVLHPRHLEGVGRGAQRNEETEGSSESDRDSATDQWPAMGHLSSCRGRDLGHPADATWTRRRSRPAGASLHFS